MEKKFAIISDIHSNYLRFDKVLKQIKEKNIENYIFCGDYILDGFDGNKVLNTIKNMKNTIIVKGNKEEIVENITKEEIQHMKSCPQYCNVSYGVESLSSDNKEYIKSLPIYEIKEEKGIRICVFHGTPYSSLDSIRKDDKKIFHQLIKDFQCQIYIFGHTHEAWCSIYEDTYFINAGSISMPLGGQVAQYGILTLKQKEISYQTVELPYDFEEVLEYYRSHKEYCEKVEDWCRMIVTMIRDGQDYRKDAFSYARELAKSKKIDYADEIPDSIWKEMFKVCEKKYRFVKL